MKKNPPVKTKLLSPCGRFRRCDTCEARGWCRFVEEAEPSLQIEGLAAEEEKRCSFPGYGIAVDLGTTTLAGVLLGARGVLAETAAVNPQVSLGADVLTRAQRSTEGFQKRLQTLIQEAIGRMIQSLCTKAGISKERVTSGVITGNTVMLYLLTGRNPACLTKAPFVPDCLFDRTQEISGILFYLPPCVSAFIGADALCSLLASRITEQEEAGMLADLGTNGEIMLWHKEKLTCCSAAAGPAFEGYGLSHGMPAEEGAVDRAAVAAGRLIPHVIGETEPKGICGSGMIDLLAVFRQLEIVEENGYMEKEYFMVTPGDVRMVQMAKSAVCAGIQTLMEEAEAAPGQISGLWIAGGFGKHLNPQSAGAIGLIPFGLTGKMHTIGNGALAGAVQLLRKPETIQKMRRLAQLAQTLDLTSSDVFAKRYLEGMRLAPVL